MIANGNDRCEFGGSFEAGSVSHGGFAGRRGDTEPPQSRARFDAEAASADATKLSYLRFFRILFLHTSACRTSAITHFQLLANGLLWIGLAHRLLLVIDAQKTAQEIARTVDSIVSRCEATG